MSGVTLAQDIAPHGVYPVSLNPWTAEELDLGASLYVSPAVEESTFAVSEDVADPLVEVNGAVQEPAGKWRTSFHFGLETGYNDNIFIQPDNTVEDFVYSTRAGFDVGYWADAADYEGYLDRDTIVETAEKGAGSFAAFRYTAIFVGFAHTSSQNAVNQEALFESRLEFTKLTLGARSAIESVEEPNADVGNRVRQNRLATSATVNYELTPKLDAEMTFSNTVQDVEGYARSVEWENENFLVFGVSSRLQLGMGMAVGYLDVEESGSQVFERILARGSYSISEKLNITGVGGVEFRQSEGALGDQVDPVLAVEIDFAPAELTTVELDLYSAVETSALDPDRNYTASGVALKLSRGMRGGLLLRFETGYEYADYTQLAGEPDRADNRYFARPSILYHISERASMELAYEYRRNISTVPSSEFLNNVVTFRLGFLY